MWAQSSTVHPWEEGKGGEHKDGERHVGRRREGGGGESLQRFMGSAVL